MTISVHENNAWVERDRLRYVEVGRHHYTEHLPRGTEPFDRIDFADPDDTCLRPMRKWTAPFAHGTVEQHGYCLMDKGHRGRCSTVVFYCDSCGKARRGNPSYSDESVSLCWMCHGLQRVAGYRGGGWWY